MKILSLFLFPVMLFTNSVLAQNKIQASIDRFAADPTMQHASITFKVVDLQTGTTVAEYNPHLTMPTASTAKLFSTATALDILGPEYRHLTRIYYNGTIDTNGVLHGDLWIRGGGDPSLGSKYFNAEDKQLDFMNEWVKAVREAGIKEVRGSVFGDASEFSYHGAPDGWTWSDLGNYYGAGPSGLTIYDNLLEYRFNVPSTPGQLTKLKSISPEVPGLNYHNYVLSSSKSGDNAYLYGAPYSLDRFGSGTLPAGSSNFLVKGSLPDPEWQCAYEFDKALKAAGIKVHESIFTVRQSNQPEGGERYAKMQLIHTHKGEKLLDIIYHTNMRSINLFAEHMLTTVGYTETGFGSTYSGIEVLEKHWKAKFDIEGMEVTDGSGLSRSMALSADHFTNLLRYMYTSTNSEEFKYSLPVAGKSGTLRSVCAGQAAQDRMLAKSGSINRVRSYAGYIFSSSGKHYCFALIVNNFTCSSSAAKTKMESVFNAMAVN